MSLPVAIANPAPLSMTTASPLLVAVLVIAVILIAFFLRDYSTKNSRSHRRLSSRGLPRYKWEALETDRILEKVSNSGLESLTDAERRHLSQTSELHQRRKKSEKPDLELWH
jgi:hypothetical protein